MCQPQGDFQSLSFLHCLIDSEWCQDVWYGVSNISFSSLPGSGFGAISLVLVSLNTSSVISFPGFNTILLHLFFRVSGSVKWILQRESSGENLVGVVIIIIISVFLIST